MSFPARLVANASIGVFKPTFDNALSGQAFCHLELGTGGTYTPFSAITRSVETFEVVAAGIAVFRQMDVTGAVDVEPGTYDVRASCSRRNNAPYTAGLTQQGAELTVVAAAR